MKHKHLVLLTAVAFAFSSPVLAQRGHPGGGPPAGHGPSSMPGSAAGSANMGGGVANRNAPMNASEMSHASPGDVLSHNTVIAGKIQSLTGEDAATACGGFKNLGQCVAAAHLAKNLNIPGGFDALKAKITGSGAMSLGKAVATLAPGAHSKSEVKRANKQASTDMKAASS